MVVFLYAGQDSPIIKQIHNILKPDTTGVAARWYNLGIQLNMETGTLDSIKADNPNDVNASCTAMFNQWLRTTPDASWNKLVCALNSIDMSQAASDLDRQLTGINEGKLKISPTHTC